MLPTLCSECEQPIYDLARLKRGCSICVKCESTQEAEVELKPEVSLCGKDCSCGTCKSSDAYKHARAKRGLALPRGHFERKDKRSRYLITSTHGFVKQQAAVQKRKQARHIADIVERYGPSLWR